MSHFSPKTLTIPSPDTLKARRHEIVGELALRGLITDEEPLCGVVDLDTVDELIGALRSAFPESTPTMHTVAAKAITLRPMLAYFARSGLGCEVASPGELGLAIAAGFAPERIIFDSPAKTRSEIVSSLRLGVSFNVDNFEELARVDELIAQAEGPIPHIGVRINPQTGSGTIGAMSTATQTSKFGIGLTDHRDELIDAFASRPWLTQLHVHSGSQGLALEHTAQGVRLIVDLANEISERVGFDQVKRIDVGGGLSVNFASDEITPTFEDHRAALEYAVPELFSGRFMVITEFGRALTAKAGTLVTRVEYTKSTGGRPIAITHAGVQVATRTVFMPEHWPLRIEVFDAAGVARPGPESVQDIAGPACFSGDMLAVGRALPRVRSSDLIALPETGGYYFSSHFSYNALARPAVYAVFTDEAGARQWSVARHAQTVEQIIVEAGVPELVPLEA
ncbi:diaminopimelate decarboxylase (plasmid) [Arthrobacter sp. StoSoilB3]|nr:diaminopimelate decarboxylase [Arthrobacter sp. StoSoilB3]